EAANEYVWQLDASAPSVWDVDLSHVIAE
ncbi:MAG: hypothetical protein JWP95_684, partial [Actinotalea sp.]|nr:hypothetical protein [Actinotalea sp.]